MDINQIKQVVAGYKDSFTRKGYVKAIRYDANEVANHQGIYPHLLWMCQEILDDKVDGEKSHRWLGFIQGVLWGRLRNDYWSDEGT